MIFSQILQIVQCTVTHQSIISSHLNNLSCLNNSNSNIILWGRICEKTLISDSPSNPPKWLPNQIDVRVSQSEWENVNSNHINIRLLTFFGRISQIPSKYSHSCAFSPRFARRECTASELDSWRVSRDRDLHIRRDHRHPKFVTWWGESEENARVNLE